MKEYVVGALVVFGIILAITFGNTFSAVWAALAIVFAFLSWQDQQIYKMLNERIAHLEAAERSRKIAGRMTE